MRNLLYIVFALLLFASCLSEAEMPQPSAPETVDADSMGTFELTLSGERQTRGTTTTISKEQADNFLVTIYKGTDLYRETVLLKNIDKKLSAGYGYTLKAESCSEATAESSNDGWGERRYMGLSAPFAIKPGQTTHVDVTCTVANAGLEAVFDKTVTTYFTGGFQVTVTEGGRDIVFDRATGGLSADGIATQHSQVAYFNVGDDGTRTITYHIHAESPRKTLDRDIEITLNRARISRATINYEMSTFSFDITVDEEELTVEDYLYIEDSDIKVDDGATDASTTHDGYTDDNTDVDIDNYDNE